MSRTYSKSGTKNQYRDTTSQLNRALAQGFILQASVCYTLVHTTYTNLVLHSPWVVFYWNLPPCFVCRSTRRMWCQSSPTVPWNAATWAVYYKRSSLLLCGSLVHPIASTCSRQMWMLWVKGKVEIVTSTVTFFTSKMKMLANFWEHCNKEFKKPSSHVSSTSGFF